MADANPYQAAAFGKLLPEWQRVVDTLTKPGFIPPDPTPSGSCPDLAKLGRRIHDCCRWPALYQTTDGLQLVTCESRCRSRLCPRCGRSRARAATARLSDLVDVMDAPRFLTLTLASTDASLGQQIRQLTTSFQRLRRQADWRHHVRGGVYTIEVTLNAKTGRWHPHLHALIDGTYYPQSSIKEAWKQASEGSTIVDIRACHSRTSAARYMAEYIGKSASAEHIHADRLHEWAAGTHGVRMLQTWGSLHGLATEPDEDIERPKLERVSSLLALAMAAADGQQEAAQLWADLHEPTLHLPYNGTPTGTEARKLEIQALTRRLASWEATRWHTDAEEKDKHTDKPTRHELHNQTAQLWTEPPPSALVGKSGPPAR